MRVLAYFHRYNFLPEIPGEVRFNASLIESGDGFLLSFRNSWRDSRLYVAWLTKDLQPTGKWKKLEFPGRWKGHEDGRFFRHNGALWIAFVGFTGFETSVLYARLNEQTMEVEQFFWPQYMMRNKHEKSWSMFSHEGQLHAIYSTQPHSVITFTEPGEGEDPYVEKAHSTPFAGEWAGGPLRGGASPVLVGEEWWHWIHGYTMQSDGRRLYTMGCVVFESKPPFRITRYTPTPIDTAKADAYPRGERNDSIFPCGAVLRDGQWLISMGVQDHWLEIRGYPHKEIESKLHAH